MSEKLKPCPFCGSDNVRAWDNSVTCRECDASGPDLGHCVGDKCREASIVAWNTRHTEEPSTFERMMNNG